MTPEQTQLAKSLVALGLKNERFFRWMPGMAYVLRGGAALWGNLRVRDDPEQIAGLRKADSEAAWPRLADPATAGCLEYILNEIAEVEQWEGKTHCHVADDGNYRKDFFMRTSGDCIGEVRAKAIKAIAKAEGVE